MATTGLYRTVTNPTTKGLLHSRYLLTELDVLDRIELHDVPSTVCCTLRCTCRTLSLSLSLSFLTLRDAATVQCSTACMTTLSHFKPCVLAVLSVSGTPAMWLMGCCCVAAVLCVVSGCVVLCCVVCLCLWCRQYREGYAVSLVEGQVGG